MFGALTALAISGLLSLPASAASEFPILGDPVTLSILEAPKSRSSSPIVITGDTEKRYILVKFRVTSTVFLASASLYCGSIKILRESFSEEGTSVDPGALLHEATPIGDYFDGKTYSATAYVDTKQVPAQDCTWRVITRTFVPNLITTFNTSVKTDLRAPATTNPLPTATPKPTAEPFKINGLSVVLSKGKATFSWDQTLYAEYGVTNYQYRLSGKNSSRFGSWKFLDFNYQEIVLKGLTKGAKYTFAIRPVTPSRTGPQSIKVFTSK
jgi:hypothetical protein